MASMTGRPKQFLVGGKQYSPELSTPLCKYEGIFEAVTLYQSPSGTFFTFRESTMNDMRISGAAVEVLSEAAALSFMDEHADGIYTENYARVFGEPEQG